MKTNKVVNWLIFIAITLVLIVAFVCNCNNSSKMKSTEKAMDSNDSKKEQFKVENSNVWLATELDRLNGLLEIKKQEIRDLTSKFNNGSISDKKYREEIQKLEAEIKDKEFQHKRVERLLNEAVSYTSNPEKNIPIGFFRELEEYDSLFSSDSGKHIALTTESLDEAYRQRKEWENKLKNERERAKAIEKEMIRLKSKNLSAEEYKNQNASLQVKLVESNEKIEELEGMLKGSEKARVQAENKAILANEQLKKTTDSFADYRKKVNSLSLFEATMEIEYKINKNRHKQFEGESKLKDIERVEVYITITPIKAIFERESSVIRLKFTDPNGKIISNQQINNPNFSMKYTVRKAKYIAPMYPYAFKFGKPNGTYKLQLIDEMTGTVIKTKTFSLYKRKRDVPTNSDK